MKNLFIAWNTFSIVEFLGLVKNPEDYYIFVDEDYNKNDLNSLSNLLKKCEEEKLCFKVLNREEVFKHKYSIVITSSFLNQYIVDILDNIQFINLQLLEDGFGDYLRKEITNYEYYYSFAILYVNNLKGISCFDGIKRIKEIRYEHKDNLRKFYKILDLSCLKDLNNDSIVLFTSPMDEDYSFQTYMKETISYLEKKYEGKTIYVKNHPRDNLVYFSKKINLIPINKIIPSQIVEQRYDCKKIYAHPSTTILCSKDVSKTDILKFKNLKDKGYLDQFNYVKMKKCNIIEI